VLKSHRHGAYGAGSIDYAEADTLPVVTFALPAALFWFADVIQSRTGDATKIEL
jgi:hypothetical protein